MKLRNKKTGEVIDSLQRSELILDYSSLAELNEEWEDVPEEPKEIYYLTERGVIDSATDMSNFTLKMMKEIGNCFETPEEAELALRKLKAWKRLEDKGFRFGGYEIVEGNIHFIIDLRPFAPDDLFPDLDLLFGGEE